MNPLPRTNDTHIRTAQLLLAWCCVLVYAMWAVGNMPFYAESKALSIGTALYLADVSKEELDLALDAALAVDRLMNSDAIDDEDVETVYLAVTKLAEMDSADTSAVGVAYQYPRETAKAPLALLRYASLKEKIKEVADTYQRESDVRLTREEWEKSAVELKTLAQNVVTLGEARVLDIAHILDHIRNTDNPSEEISVLELRKLWQCALDLTDGVDIGKLYLLDFVCGVGFTYAAGEDIAYLASELHALEGDRLMDIALYLPNKERAVYQLVHYLFAERGIDPIRVAILASTLQAYGLMPDSVNVKAALEEIDLLKGGSEAPTEEEWQQIAPHVGALLASISLS